jgi:hypothetical protein
VATPAGFEPATPSLEVSRSINLAVRPHSFARASHRVEGRSLTVERTGHVLGVGPRHPPVIGQSGQTQCFYRSDFSHPISHRTPHYRVGNGVIGWLVISQKRLNFGMKLNCKIQGKMDCNGLGNRCSVEALSGPRSSELVSNSMSADSSKNSCFKGHL